MLELCTSSLSERLKQQPPLTNKQCLQTAVGVALALAHLHAQTPPMIHRDVKPGNVLLNTQSASSAVDMVDAVKLADFGTVRADVRTRQRDGVGGPSHIPGTDTESNQADHASTKMIVGTLVYMPAEYVSMGR